MNELIHSNDLVNQVVGAVTTNVNYLLNQAQLVEGDLFVLGLSTSEVDGGVIGKQSNTSLGEKVVATVHKLLEDRGIYLAVQCCEHLNRALVVERDVARRFNLSEVWVVPQPHAGGAGATAAYQLAEEPVVVEHIIAQAGMDIGDTAIGMHVKYVQVPVRLPERLVGFAHATALRSRPKYIGGPRAKYNESR